MGCMWLVHVIVSEHEQISANEENYTLTSLAHYSQSHILTDSLLVSQSVQPVSQSYLTWKPPWV